MIETAEAEAQNFSWASIPDEMLLAAAATNAENNKLQKSWASRRAAALAGCYCRHGRQLRVSWNQKRRNRKEIGYFKKDVEVFLIFDANYSRVRSKWRVIFINFLAFFPTSWPGTNVPKLCHKPQALIGASITNDKRLLIHINHTSKSLLGVANQETGVLAIVQVYFVDQLVGQLLVDVVDQLRVSWSVHWSVLSTPICQ